MMNTVGSFCWRLAAASADLSGLRRKLTGQGQVDAVFVTNIRDQTDRSRFLGKWVPKAGHFDGPRYVLGETLSRTRALDTMTEDLLTSQGRKRAKEQFVSAVSWAQDNGAKAILLAASTKRLFGDDGRVLKAKFPGMLFTIGDNGTMLILRRETLRAFREAGLRPQESRVAVLGPYGFLGNMIVEALVWEGFSVVGAGPNVAGLERSKTLHGIDTCTTFAEMGKVDAVVACTHSKDIRLTAAAAELVRKSGRKLLVIDVSEPSNLTRVEYERSGGFIIRQDAGNAHSPQLKYVLGPISYRMFRLTDGVTFGCFAETMSIAAAMQRGDQTVRNVDWFSVTDENMAKVQHLFEQVGFDLPTPRCFGKPVASFELAVGM